MVQEEEIRAPSLNRSLSNQRLPQQYQAPGLPMAGRPPTATGVPYNAQQFTPSSTMMMAQQRPQQQPQQQQQRPPVAAAAGAGAGTQVRGGSYLQQAQQQQQQYQPAQYVHHMTSVPMSNMSAARPGVAPAYGNMQNLAVAQQHNMQARQKPNQVQTPGTQYIGGVTPGQQQALRQGPSIASQQQQQQALQHQQQQGQMQQMNAQRLAPQQQQAMVRQTQSQLQQQQQQQMLQNQNNMRVAPGGPMWQGKPGQYQQPQPQQQPQPPQQPPPQAQPRPPVAATAQARPTTPQVPNPAPAEEPAGSILGKRSIQDLLAQIDPRERLDPDVEEVFLEIADDFIENVASFSCKIAQHRKSKVLEAKDVLLHLDKAYNITVPGFGGDEYRSYKRPPVSETHKQRLALVRKSAAAGQETKAAVANASTPVKAGGVAAGASPTPSPGMPRIPRV